MLPHALKVEKGVAIGAFRLLQAVDWGPNYLADAHFGEFRLQLVRNQALTEEEGVFAL